MPSINRYATPAKLPNAQPFFELPFNEMAGAISARQQRYDAMTESLAKTQAEAAAIKAMPGADTEYVAKIQNKLKELETNYIDQDLAGPAGTDLLREIRKTALDPNITKIGQSYEGWRNYVTNVDKLKQEGKYDPSLDDNRWKTWDTVGSGSVFDGRIESWSPADLKQYYDNIEGTIEVVGEDGKVVKYVSDDDIRRVVDASGKNFYDTPDGRKWVKVDKSRTDQDAVSLYYPNKTYGELTDEEYANDILYRGGEEFKTYQENIKKTGSSGSGKSGTKKTDHFHLFSMPGGGQAIEPVIGLGGSAAGTQEVITANNSMAKHLESHEGVRSALQTAGAFGAPTEANNYQGVNLNPAVLDRIEFKVVETPDGGKKVIWETKELIDPETGNELPGPTVEEASKIDKAISNNPNIISTLIAGAEAHRRTATAANQFMSDLKAASQVPKEYKIKPEQMAAYNEKYGEGIRDIVLNPDDKFWGEYSRSTEIATEFGQYVESKIPLNGKYTSRDITNYMFYGTGPAVGSEVPHTITAQEASEMHIPELAKEFIRDYYKRELENDATLTPYQREHRMNTLDQRIVKAQFDAYGDVGDPNFTRLSEAYKQATQESAIFDTPHYTFGTTPAAKAAYEQLEKGVNDDLKTRSVGLYDARTNELIPWDEGWFDPDKSEEGGFTLVGWRPDASKNTSGTVLLLNYKNKDGNSDGRLYEVRDFGGISKYLVDEDQGTIGSVTLIEESHKLNQALADNNYYRATYSMGDGYPTVSVRRLPTDIVSSTGQVLQPKGTLEFIDPFTKTPVYASNEEDMFNKYYQMTDNNMGRIRQELPLLNKFAEEANVKPNYQGAGKGRVIPSTEIAEFINSTSEDDNVPNSLLYRVINVESAGDATAVNPKSGAAGIAQIMPTTAASPGFGIGPVNPFDPKDSIRFAKEYLSALSSRYQKSGAKSSNDLQTLMLVGYYGGQEAADFLFSNNMDTQKLKEKFPNSYEYLTKFQGNLNLPSNLKY